MVHPKQQNMRSLQDAAPTTSPRRCCKDLSSTGPTRSLKVNCRAPPTLRHGTVGRRQERQAANIPHQISRAFHVRLRRVSRGSLCSQDHELPQSVRIGARLIELVLNAGLNSGASRQTRAQKSRRLSALRPRIEWRPLSSRRLPRASPSVCGHFMADLSETVRSSRNICNVSLTPHDTSLWDALAYP